MQKGLLKSDNVGDGIYHKSKRRKTFQNGENEKITCSELDTIDTTNPRDGSSNRSPIEFVGGENYLEINKSEQQQPDCSTQQVFDALEQPIDTLTKPLQLEQAEQSKINRESETSSNSHIDIEELLSIANNVSPEARGIVLEYYVKQGIDCGGSGECGCRFDDSLKRRTLLNELDERFSESLSPVDKEELLFNSDTCCLKVAERVGKEIERENSLCDGTNSPTREENYQGVERSLFIGDLLVSGTAQRIESGQHHRRQNEAHQQVSDRLYNGSKERASFRSESYLAPGKRRASSPSAKSLYQVEGISNSYCRLEFTSSEFTAEGKFDSEEEESLSEIGNVLEGLSGSTSDISSNSPTSYQQELFASPRSNLEFETPELCTFGLCCNRQLLNCSLTDESTLSLSCIESSNPLKQQSERNNLSNNSQFDGNRRRNSFPLRTCNKRPNERALKLNEAPKSIYQNSLHNSDSPHCSKSDCSEDRHSNNKQNCESAGRPLPVIGGGRDVEELISDFRDNWREVVHSRASDPVLRKFNCSREILSRSYSSTGALDSTSINDEESIMKALKDIARASIPSLSSLQYLPSQLNSKTTFDKMIKGDKLKIEPSEEPRSRSAAALEMSQSRESMKSDDSFLQRLCLCNCVAKTKQQDCGTEGVSKSKIKSTNHKSKASSLSSLSASARATKSRTTAPFSERMKHSKDEDLGAEQKTELFGEKQSPSFLKILRNSRRQSPHNPREQKSICKAEFEQDSGRLKSQDDIATTALVSNSQSSNYTDLGGECSAFSRTRSASHLGDCQTPISTSDVLDSDRPLSSCSNGGEKASSYRKFLSPIRLFNSSQQPDEGIIKEETPPRCSKSKSLLTRSLNRLSCRARSSSKEDSQLNSPALPLTDEPPAESLGSVCTSPTSSVLTEPKSVDDFSTSLNEVESVNVSIRTPEIVLNEEIEIQQATNIARLSEMTKKSRRTKNRDKNNRNSPSNSPGNSTRYLRCGSEYSDFTSEAGSDRAFSLPPSPRAHKRGVSSRNHSPRLEQSPVSFKSPANLSTRIEDGLKVCSTEHFEKHIGNIKSNQIDTQKHLFQAWINHFCPNLIQRDLVEELRDGIKLIGLLSHLTRDRRLMSQYHKLIHDKQSFINRLVMTPSSRLKHLSNVSVAIDYLRNNRNMKLINLNPMDIVSGKPNVILGLCWNIILSFQLEQNYLRHLDGFYSLDSSLQDCYTSKEFKSYNRSMSMIDEYSYNDLVEAKKKLLEHINRRFNFRLTNLTSGLLDGEVMLEIIKQLAPKATQPTSELWHSLSDNEKLDHCFQLAHKYLNIPHLLSASDLDQQTGDNSKPMFVYLSMLLSSGSFEEVETDNSAKPRQLLPINSATEDKCAFEQNIRNYLKELDTNDKFHVGKLQSTLSQINKLDRLLREQAEQGASLSAIEDVVDRCERLKSEADQVENLIDWINRADNLFGTTQKSANDLVGAIESYKSFFSPSNVPCDTSSCPTLERQYRECLGTAKQRILSMEQALANRVRYEEAKKRLLNWLAEAEAHLSSALLPSDSESEVKDFSIRSRHKEQLDKLISFFELEDVESNLDGSSLDIHNSSTSGKLGDWNRLSNMDDVDSVSGSLLSLGSTSSRLSTLRSSKKAIYHELFDNFELKCRLLATMLDSEQRDALLYGSRELKGRLKHITEQRVPWAINELRISIEKCEMFTEAQNERNDLSSDLMGYGTEEPSEDTTEPVSAISQTRSPSSVEPDADVANISDCELDICSQLEGSMLSEGQNCCYQTEKLTNKSAVESCSGQPVRNTKAHRKIARRVPKKKSKNALDFRSTAQEKTSSQTPCIAEVDKEPERVGHWFLLDWLFSRNNDAKTPKSKVIHSKMRKKSTPKKRSSKVADTSVVDSKESSSTGEESQRKSFWRKVVQAYRNSIPLNIILLICLVGIYVVPLLNRDACCELTQNNIPSSQIRVSEKPT